MADTDTLPAVRTIVRRAVAADIPELVWIGKRFFEESGYAKQGVLANPQKLHDSLTAMLSNEGEAVFVMVQGGIVAGCIGLKSFSTYFSDSLMALELFWWVKPDVRGGAGAIRLLDAAEKWAADIGCQAFCMTDLPGIKSPAARIYERRGYALAEQFWIKKVSL